MTSLDLYKLLNAAQYISIHCRTRCPAGVDVKTKRNYCMWLNLSIAVWSHGVHVLPLSVWLLIPMATGRVSSRPLQAWAQVVKMGGWMEVLWFCYIKKGNTSEKKGGWPLHPSQRLASPSPSRWRPVVEGNQHQLRHGASPVDWNVGTHNQRKGLFWGVYNLVLAVTMGPSYLRFLSCTTIRVILWIHSAL